MFKHFQSVTSEKILVQKIETYNKKGLYKAILDSLIRSPWAELDSRIKHEVLSENIQ